MRVAVLSDIHSNQFALRAVLGDIRRLGITELWLGGDIFGYYPWAAEAYAEFNGEEILAVCGNHDHWVAHPDRAPDDIAGAAARHNAGELARRTPAALDWLAALPAMRSFIREGWRVTIAHGTPDDPLDGRYYPDDPGDRRWLPREGEILILGQTHYPLLRGDAAHGLMLNPGSVGQPRDGTSMASWALIDLATGVAELRRTAYDVAAAMSRLRELGWNERITAALNRTGSA